MHTRRIRVLAQRARLKYALLLVLGITTLHCARGPSAGAGEPAPRSASGLPAANHAPRGGAPVEIPGVPLGQGHTVGAPRVVESLAVFPIYGRTLEDIGKFTTLSAALERKTAIVRELGAEGGDGAPSMGESSARVNTLVIENKGDVPILVLAGTVVKGGKQDRQIGQDFIVAANETVPVDAYCVEHGRWNAEREGAATGGTFSAMKVLAGGEVRAAGQYEQNQSEVWAKVGSVNAANKKSAASGTLTATLDDEGLAKEREALAAELEGFLGGAPASSHVVGMAYAIGGEVQGVRWFMNHELFELYEDSLISTAAVDAFTERARASDEKRAPAAGACKEAAVIEFVSGIQAGRAEERATPAANVNTYRFADEGYGSEAAMKSSGTPKAVTSDFLKKKKKK